MPSDARLDFRAWPRTVVAADLAVLVAAGGLWLTWAERDDVGVVVLIGTGTLAGTTLLARIAACRVWTDGCTLRVRNSLRSYRLAASEISGIQIGRTHESDWLGAEGPLVVTDSGRRILLQGAERFSPTWIRSGTASEVHHVAALAAWHRRCRWGLSQRAQPPLG
jgi:hypothetical protein